MPDSFDPLAAMPCPHCGEPINAEVTTLPNSEQVIAFMQNTPGMFSLLNQSIDVSTPLKLSLTAPDNEEVSFRQSPPSTKVVISRDVNGFELSVPAMVLFLRRTHNLKGVVPYVTYVTKCNGRIHHHNSMRAVRWGSRDQRACEWNDELRIQPYAFYFSDVVSADLGDWVTDDQINELCLDDPDFNIDSDALDEGCLMRTDAILVSVVEELGPCAWGSDAELEVVTIPPDFGPWAIDNEHGIETVYQKHRRL